MSDTTSRQLLLAIGMTQHNTTLAMPYMMIAPATTDPKIPMVINMVRLLQRKLWQMGATDVADTGALDMPTATALLQIVGPNWERQSWAANLNAVLSADARGVRIYSPPPESPIGPDLGPAPIAVGGPLDFLPDIPGGLITYGILGFLLYRHIAKKKRSS